ncbi:MAG: NADH-quinone oxidoreductase subunit NuoE [Candidatus Eisenbacteria bacterium]|uniref:NADH-quinone oxidoreductase subunit NuoE n=1 Tax=Eiseniibacteriota bacterium TaxID=2212470 RepID=A0A948W6I2_UNCEI|nr:NADH-quinone oxidoreductase subunit NuoE [Candidatus Eisenbacteria bacterium]MBU2691539.1 NADH-quinone oxidoreductase subunit NuoE [Candidatus Eisenbacteria bacterium]
MAGSTSRSTAPILEKYAPQREYLIPILQDVQAAEGYLSPASIREISRRLRITENDIYGVATFYSHFRFVPPGEHSIHVCMGTACHVRGGQPIGNMLERMLGIRQGQTTPDGKFELHHVNCLGCCAIAPVIKIDETIHGKMSVLKVGKVMDEIKK